MSDQILRVEWIDSDQAGMSLNRIVVPWCKKLMAAGQHVVAEFRLSEDCKTDQQRKYYHGVILKEIAQQAVANGQKFPLAVWKEHFRAEYLGFKTVTHVNPMTGKKHRRRIRISTEDLGVRAYNKLIERVTSFAVTDLGVEFSVPRLEQYGGHQVDPETGEIMEYA